ncbi:hypothetical protein [Sphaerisporangium corydalis]|uniref:FPG-type domain-containing protein n=1 Tax=Sphaerisporangium corydalis TaxID=1441875 RepID=A0ABV9EJ30_9ACTN|nr:hypothetical protein [Sphaerisporangium corydalis]
MTPTPADQAVLFTVDHETDTPISGVTSAGADPAASDAALAGDGYLWLAAALPRPRPPACQRCRTPEVLPASAPVLWTCPACHPQEAR